MCVRRRSNAPGVLSGFQYFAVRPFPPCGRAFVMEKSVWVKIVWLGAVLAIPAAVLAVQKPEAPRASAEGHRVITVEQPFAVDISDRQIEGAKAAESAAPAPDAPK